MDVDKSQIEPIFKYLRIASDLKDILKNDSVSCVAATSKIIFIGTNWGHIFILDHQGNEVSGQKFPKHMVSINEISVDSKGEYIATCSDDGKVKFLYIILIFITYSDYY